MLHYIESLPKVLDQRSTSVGKNMILFFPGSYHVAEPLSEFFLMVLSVTARLSSCTGTLSDVHVMNSSCTSGDLR